MRPGVVVTSTELDLGMLGRHRPRQHSALRTAAAVLATFVLAVAAPVLAAPCNDSDGDGFQAFDVPSGCDFTPPADCNDGNALDFPGALERCDGADNDCDGTADDGPGGGDLGCLVGDGPGCPSPMPASPDPDPTVNPGIIAHCCYLKGICSSGTCDVDPNNLNVLPPVYAAEGPQPFSKNQPTVCFDGQDNDCDGLKDSADNSVPPGGAAGDMCRLPTDQFCNGFDDDFDGSIDEDFPNFGQACSAGSGGCQKIGTFICNAAGDGTTCSATPGQPKPEGLGNGNSCIDGIDNDCDGNADIADAACQQPEICDGLDNDGNDGADEDFPGLGSACTVGIGACARNGTTVCGLDKQSTRCDVSAGIASPEGPAGATCSDAIDNDCDGLTDGGDPSCGSAQLAVECSLPLVPPGSNNDCRAMHEIDFTVLGAGANSTITAELLAMSSTGEILGSLPVQDGDKALLFSTTRKLRLKTSGNVHRVTAPIPVLHVKVDDGNLSAQAFCSPIPFVKAFDPGCCGFTSRSAGDTTPVTVAIPGIDPKTLKLFIDGVDIFAQLGIDPATQFPGGPFPAGNVTIGGESVQVKDLVVNVTANTVTLNLVGLPCGGHLITTQGTPIPDAVPNGPKSCYVDDYKDKCVAAVLGVEIDFPAPQQTDLPSPTPVRGTVCHGRQISNLRLNGAEQPVTPVTLIKGDGKTSADTYRLSFDALLPGTDLRRAVITGQTPLGHLDRGSNRLVADVVDEFGNRDFANVIFAVGPVSAPNVGPLQLQAKNAARSTLEAAIQATTNEIHDAFVLGLNEEALDTIIDSTCAEKGTEFLTNVQNSFLNPVCKPVDPILKGAPCGSTDGETRCTNAGGVCSALVCHAEGNPLDQTPCDQEQQQLACRESGGVCARLCGPSGGTLDDAPCGSFGEIQNCYNAGGTCPASIQVIETPFCTCNIPAVIRPTNVVQIDPNDRITCDASLVDGAVRFTMNIPDLRVSMGVHGSCDGFLCANASIDYDGSTDLTDMSVVLEVTEGRLEGTPEADPALCGNGTRDAGEFCDPTAADGSSGCATDFGGGDKHCTVSTGTACNEDGDCPGGERCRPDASCSETCVACTQPPLSSELSPPIGDDAVDLGCGCALVQFLTLGLVVLAFIFGGPILGFGALGIAALIFALAFQFDIETISPPTAVETDPIGIAEPAINENVEEFGVQVKGEIENVEITPAGMTTSLKGIFSVLDPDNENPEVPGAVLTPAPVPAPPPLPGDTGNSYFVLADDSFNQMFASLAAGPSFKTGFEVSSSRSCSVTTEQRCEQDSDCPGGETCVAPKVCEPTVRTECTLNSQCPANQECITCPVGETCVTKPKLCVPELYQNCQVDADCPSNHACRTPKVCAITSEIACTQDSDCGSAGTCIPCPPGQTCGSAKICDEAVDKKCTSNADCAAPQTCVDDARLKVLNFVPNLNSPDQGVLRLALALLNITGNTPLIVHGRPEMPPQLLIDDDPKRCAISNLRCEIDDDCKQCSVSNERCSSDANCPTGETCALDPGDTCVVKPATTPVETNLRITDFFLELIADRDGHGLDGTFGSSPGCFKSDSPKSGDCNAIQICLDVSYLTAMEIGQCVNSESGELQPQMVTVVEAVQVGPTLAPKGEVCGQIAQETPNDEATEGGFDTQTIDVFKNNAEQNTPPLCVDGMSLAGLGTFDNPRLISVDVPGGDPNFEDYLGLSGDVVAP